MLEKDLVESESDQSCMITNENGDLVPDYDQTIKVFDDGDIVSGEVVKVDKDEVLVDIGYKSEGAIPSRELSIRADVDPLEVVSVGDHIDALVLQKEDKDGRLILSKKRAEYEKSWIRIEDLAKQGETVTGQVIEVVKGGLILDIGLRGFLPASLVDLRRVKDLEQYVGNELCCKIIEMDRNRNNVVLSRRAVLEEERKQERQDILAKIEKGQVLTGKISSIVDFGAFVDLGGIDGLIHISELCWGHVDHPSEIVDIGNEVKVKVLDVDSNRERVSLGLRQTQDDPWKEVTDEFKIGEVVEGSVTKLVPFGAFVQIAEGVEGLVHISELAEQHVEIPEEVIKVGDEVEVKIVGLDVERRRISLSIKQAQVSEEAEEKDEEPADVQQPEAGVAQDGEETAEQVAAEAEVAEPVEAEVAEPVEQDDDKTEAQVEVDTDQEVESAEAEVDDATDDKTSAELIESAVSDDNDITVDPGSLEDVLEEMKASRVKENGN